MWKVKGNNSNADPNASSNMTASQRRATDTVTLGSKLGASANTGAGNLAKAGQHVANALHIAANKVPGASDTVGKDKSLMHAAADHIKNGNKKSAIGALSQVSTSGMSSIPGVVHDHVNAMIN